jgi:hypothetical protein
MKTYIQFKKENGVEKFNFRQSKRTSRWVADYGKPLMVSKNFKGNAKELVEYLKDAFVTVVTHDLAGMEYPEPLFVICHQGWGDSAEG